MRTRRVRFYVALLALDLAAIVGGWAIAGAVRFGTKFPSNSLTIIAVILILYMLLSARAFTAEVLANWRTGAGAATVAISAATALIIFVGFALRTSESLSRQWMISGALCAFALLSIFRKLASGPARRAFGNAPMSRLLITDGIEVEAPEGTSVFDATGMGLSNGIMHPLMLDQLGQRASGFDNVVVAAHPDSRRAWANALQGSDIPAAILVPELDACGALGCARFAGLPMVSVSAGALKLREELTKRTLDVTLAATALVIVAPLLLFTALAIRVETPGPVFFVQRRVGRANRIFNVYKFRSMFVDGCDRQGICSVSRSDPRVTIVGRFIRATSIDELPQLLNILRGEMSFVGPRPHAIESKAESQPFWEIDDRYHYRHACRPGLTGLAQVRGFRGATERREDLINRLQSDLEYISGWTLLRDLAILCATVRVIVHRNAF